MRSWRCLPQFCLFMWFEHALPPATLLPLLFPPSPIPPPPPPPRQFKLQPDLARRLLQLEAAAVTERGGARPLRELLGDECRWSALYDIRSKKKSSGLLSRVPSRGPAPPMQSWYLRGGNGRGAAALKETRRVGSRELGA